MCKIKTESFSQSESFRSCTANIFLTNTPSTAITREVEIKKEKSDFFRFFPFSPSSWAGDGQFSTAMGSSGTVSTATGSGPSGVCPGVDSGSGGGGWLRMTCTT